MVKRILCILFLVFLLIGCNKQKETGQNQSKSKTEESNQASSNTTKKEYDFNNYSSQGGVIFAYFTNDKLDKFDIYLLGERGKVIYEYTINKDKSVNIVRNLIEYNQSIYDGDVEIATQEKTEYLLKKNTLYSIVDKKIKESKEKEIHELYQEAIKTMNEQNP